MNQFNIGATSSTVSNPTPFRVDGDARGDAADVAEQKPAEDHAANDCDARYPSGEDPPCVSTMRADGSAGAEAPRGLRPTLRLKRPLETGTVRQSASPGRGKAVLVERVKRRVWCRRPKSRNCLRRVGHNVAAVKGSSAHCPSPWRHRRLMAPQSPLRRTCKSRRLDLRPARTPALAWRMRGRGVCRAPSHLCRASQSPTRPSRRNRREKIRAAPDRRGAGRDQRRTGR